jgi:hypothetical protein
MNVSPPPRLPIPRLRSRTALASAVTAAAALLLGGCGGGGDPLSNPPSVTNPPGQTGESLSFAYFQQCINPIFLEKIVQNGGSSTNTCAGSGCHDSEHGTGGALRIIAAAQPVVLTDPANTPDVVRETDMYKNFYSAQGVTVPGNPTQSRLFQKPLLLNILHGGGQIFTDENDPHAQKIAYWISHPVPAGQDEFSSSANSMFTPPDPATGQCNTQ